MIVKNTKGFGLGWVVVALAVIGVLGTGYFVYSSNKSNNAETANQQTTETKGNQETDSDAVSKEDTSTAGKVIAVGDSEFGLILFDGAGQAIYIWEVEESSTAECYGECAQAWPPVLTDGAPIASNGVNAELLGTTIRNDGTTQVTYNGHPLYYYADEKVGEVKCHNVATHGGLWWVLQPNGVRAI